MFIQAISTLSAALVLALACGYAGAAMVSGDLAQQTMQDGHGPRPAAGSYSFLTGGVNYADQPADFRREILARPADAVDALSGAGGSARGRQDAGNGGTILLDTQFHDPESGDKAPVCACLIPVDKIRFRGGPHGETRPRHPRLGALG